MHGARSKARKKVDSAAVFIVALMREVEPERGVFAVEAANAELARKLHAGHGVTAAGR